MINMVEMMMLVNGPERAIFPVFSFVAGPAIIMAPGEMILNNGRSIEIRVMSAPCMINRNSAHNPKCCAENLWASSWRRKLSVNAVARLARMSSSTCWMKDKPTPKTRNVPRVRCLSSVVLNQKIFAVGRGA